MDTEILKEKIAQTVSILNEKDIDMWITFVRESAVLRDPVMEMIVGGNSTWQAAFIINRDGDTTAVVGSMEEENFVKAGLYKNVVGYLKSIREPLVEYIASKDPKNIAINYSKNSVLADGLSYGLYQVLLDHLADTDYKNRLVSSEEIISSLRGRKSAAELAIMKEAVKETLKIFDEVTSFIKPGMSEIDIAKFVTDIAVERKYELAWEATPS